MALTFAHPDPLQTQIECIRAEPRTRQQTQPGKQGFSKSHDRLLQVFLPRLHPAAQAGQKSGPNREN